MSNKNKIVEATGKMPFSGKYMVKNWFVNGRQASREGRFFAKLKYAAALGGFAVLHTAQLKMGVTALEHDHTNNPALMGIDGVYSLANATAAYTQAYLGGKVLLTRRSPDASTTTELGAASGPAEQSQMTPEQTETKSGGPSALDMAVTLGGQVVFMATSMH